MKGYVYLIPFVEDDETIFLKTIIPNRKVRRRYATAHPPAAAPPAPPALGGESK